MVNKWKIIILGILPMFTLILVLLIFMMLTFLSCKEPSAIVIQQRLNTEEINFDIMSQDGRTEELQKLYNSLEYQKQSIYGSDRYVQIMQAQIQIISILENRELFGDIGKKVYE